MNTKISLDLFDMMASSDMVSKLIIIILLAFSVWSWAIVFDKFFKFRVLKSKTVKFEKLFWSGQMLEDIYKQIKSSANHPIAAIFAAAMQEWEISNVVSIVKSNDVSKKNSLKDRLANVTEVAESRSMGKIKYGMNFLYIVANTSTLFGLFGTVWGIMYSFLSIAAMKDSSLLVMAPGIAGALITTVAGLIAAIPALIFYNYYMNKINTFEEDMDNFSSEVVTILSRELDQ